MIRRLRKLLEKKFVSIGETALLLAFFTFLSQLLALVRDRLLAGKIGAGAELDLYYAAFRIPDLIFVLGASLVAVSMLMPFFREKLAEGREEARSFLNGVWTLFVLFMLALDLLVFLAVPEILPRIFPGFQGESLQELIVLTRIMLLSPFLLGISNIFSTVVQTFQRFFVYALAPLLYNLGIIIGILFLYPRFGLKGLAFGVILGAFFHLAIQYRIVRREEFSPKFSPQSIRWADVKKIVQHSLPRTVALSLTRILFLVLVAVASTLAVGSVSVFQFSFNLQSVPLALIGAAYSVAAFPVLVSSFQEKRYRDFLGHVLVPIRQIIFWSLPVIVLFIVLRAHIVRVVLGTGRFDWADTRLTAASLAILVMSVLAQGIILLLIRAYYAAGKTWKPFLVQLASFLGSVAFLFLMLPLVQSGNSFFESIARVLKVSDLPGKTVLILPLTYLVSTLISLTLLSFSFRKDFVEKVEERGFRFHILRAFFQSLMASILLGVTTYFFLNFTASLFPHQKGVAVLAHAVVSALPALGVWYLFLRVIGNEDISLIQRAAHRLSRRIRQLLKGKEKVVGEIEV